MYLKSCEIENYRKFGSEGNLIEFVTPYNKSKPKSVSNATTLIVGKNNSGKTTITSALKQVVNDESLSGNKFNYNYLRKLLNSYTDESIRTGNINLPYISYTLVIGLDTDPSSFAINNISDFVDVDSFDAADSDKIVRIKIKYEVKEELEYKSLIVSFLDKAKNKNMSDEVKFREFIKIIGDEVKFVKKFYDINNIEVPDSRFKLSNLIDVKVISAGLDDDNRNLSDVFNKIVKYRLNIEGSSDNKERIEDNIYGINSDITNMVGTEHNITVNDVVGSITDKSNMEVSLRSNLDFDSMFSKLIEYEFKENGNYIPENQFGLGYKNLMKIIGQLIDYIEKYDVDKIHNKVNIICVEEPENYMHPQMQEVFIKNIDDAVDILLRKTKKKINSQLILTTHSSHILNSKIHTSNTFDNINYLTVSDSGNTKSIPLNDSRIAGRLSSGSNESKDILDKKDLNFLKKHIKFKVSDIFFADAVILVEGITEEQVLNLKISEIEELNKHYICIFNINGAYAHIYKPLIDRLEIPCLVITDIDIKRKGMEKGEGEGSSFRQMTSLQERETTNEVIKTYICKQSSTKSQDEESAVMLPTKLDYFESENGKFKIVYQKDAIGKYYASSFEEAFILTNYDNEILNATLRELKPTIYKRIVGKIGDVDYEKNKDSSYEWQRKLSSNKSDFANTLIYHMISSDEAAPKLPDYIEDGIEWLKSKLNY
ncbi:ATP-dependent nuclease [Vibrio parahaemolyticus]|uniref:AAA family ATPase n=1 Tax=Vibrio parahaemolyticus TaxID=670 RepID=UPI00111F55B5|nr:AAA family ATPase [Vibrio parahaemolyticus]MBE4329687.1 AAA family ATPase [Vibrio parahaemolyticus]MBE4344404.1 AAA family ATPase [Vibrio parahaemolyticus]MDF4911116.1 AAA family ATPase [Vibrio parahaemolyticus]TOP38821.1 ATP-dependent endonuclease [Vibrio parahaemolyticus]HCE4729520.1 AAA family ATPase [Vibrio parahaemolyticus]